MQIFWSVTVIASLFALMLHRNATVNEHEFTLRQVDQARGDFAAILDEPGILSGVQLA